MPGHRILLAGVVALLGAGGAAQGATIPVTTTADVVADDGLCSLREAVSAAGSDLAVQGCPEGTAGEDVIQLEAADYRLAPGGASEDGNESGDLDTGPANVVRIVGRGVGATAVGGVGDRTFDVAPGATLGLADLTVRDSVAPTGESGGAVRNRGALTVLRVDFVDTAAGDGVPALSVDVGPEPAGSGGAIWSDGSLDVAAALFSGNRAGDGVDAARRENGMGGVSIYAAQDGAPGGAISVEGGTASLAGITVTGARAGSGGDRGASGSSSGGGDGGDGGAVAVSDSSVTIVNATFQGDRAGNAGDPRTFGPDVAAPGDGGAVAVAGPGDASVTFSTFSGNTAGTGGDGSSGVGASVAGASVGASILTDAAACAAGAPGGLPNLLAPGDAGCPGPRINGDARLGALAPNGGSVPTMAPGAGSPAIDALVGVPCPATDARGLPRPRSVGCDIGAVEVQPGPVELQPAPVAATGGGPGGRAAAPRAITGVRIGPAAFRSTGRRHVGTTVRFRLSAEGRVVLTVRRPAAGKRSRGRCVAPTRRLRGARACTRQVPVGGSIATRGTVGLNLIRFSGTLRGRALPPGRYTLVLTLPRAGAAPAVSVTKGFRILPDQSGR